jgi:hypothetical protein
MDNVLKKKSLCANTRINGCTEYVIKRGNIICEKCIGTKNSVIKNIKDQGNAQLIQHTNDIERKLADTKEKLENVIKQKDNMALMLNNIENNSEYKQQVGELELKIKLLERKIEEHSIMQEEYNNQKLTHNNGVEKQKKIHLELTLLNNELILDNTYIKNTKKELLTINNALKIKHKKEMDEYRKHNEELKIKEDKHKMENDNLHLRIKELEIQNNEYENKINQLMLSNNTISSENLKLLEQNKEYIQSLEPIKLRKHDSERRLRKVSNDNNPQRSKPAPIRRKKNNNDIMDKFKLEVENNLPNEDPGIEYQRKKKF